MVVSEDTGARIAWFRPGVLGEFATQAQAAFGDELRAVVLFGSAVEGRLRVTSDVNLLVVLRRFERAQAEQLQRPLRVAQATVRLTPMFLLESEVPAVAEAFAVKFDDILHRRTLLFGSDPFAQLAIPRAARVFRLKRVLLNLKLRLREQFVSRGLREEQLVLAVADTAAPLRSWCRHVARAGRARCGLSQGGTAVLRAIAA